MTQPLAPVLDTLGFASLMATCGIGGVGDGADVRHVAVAVSGGADSLSLLLLTHKWAQDVGVTLTALTVDHGLRPAAADEARQVGEWLAVHSIRHETLRWRPSHNVTTGLQARARDARYDLMTDWAREHGVQHLLVAHHLDDQAETVLMRLKKRTTLYGLGAMKPVRDCAGVKLCRPLLSVPKQALVNFLHDQNQPWIEDPSNQNLAFERVRVRAQMKELTREGVTAAHLAGAAKGARAVCSLLDAAADALIKTHVSGMEIVKIEAEFWGSPPLIIARAMSKILMQVGSGNYPPSPDKLDRLLAWAKKQAEEQPVGGRTLAGCLLRWQGGFLWVCLESPRKIKNKQRTGDFFPVQPLPQGALPLTSIEDKVVWVPPVEPPYNDQLTRHNVRTRP